MKPFPALANARQEILDIPNALRQTLTKGRPGYEALIRRMRWGEGPVYMVGSGVSAILGLAGAYAFESHLGRPVIARPAVDFRAYSLAIVQPRSVVVAISCSGEPDETLEAARAAQQRGAAVFALTANPESELAKTADGVFLVRTGEEPSSGIKAAVCQAAVLSYLSLLSARLLKRPDAQLGSILAEFEKLPEYAEWVLTQIPDAIRSFASELRSAKALCVAGAGFYHTAALQWARLWRELAGMSLAVPEPMDFRDAFWLGMNRGATAVLLSGSRCRLKKEIHEFARLRREDGSPILSITDPNDRELVSSSQLAILLPVLSEMTGSIVALIGLGYAAYEASR
jgi:fructoselysine-6-P-deglycase FrlB-like protein